MSNTIVLITPLSLIIKTQTLDSGRRNKHFVWCFMAKILVIDDCNVSRVALRLCLEQGGHTVVEAETGCEGERKFVASPTDIIFTDILMPDQDGLQTIINIRKFNKQVPIIAMSAGLDVHNYLHHSKLLGATHAVPKPMSKDVIEDLLKSVDAVEVN